MATPKLDQFLQLFREYAARHWLLASSWPGARRFSPNVVRLSEIPSDILLYVKDRSDPPGFWGLNEPQLHEIRRSGLQWYVVLLVGAEEDAYLLPSEFVDHAIAEDRWSRDSHDYKVHEGAELDGAERFRSFDELFARLPRAPVRAG
jgi:hypothetical protein